MQATTPHFVRVTHALALLGSVGVASLAGCSRPSEAQPAPPRPASSVCPANPPTRNGPCAGFAPGLECEYYGAIRCTCRAPATPTGAAAVWQCITRGAPGPLPPPELAA